MGKVESEAEAIYDKLGRGAATDVKTIRDALLAAEKRGREEERERCAVINEHFAQQWDLPRQDGTNDGFNACMEAAAAIRSGS